MLDKSQLNRSLPEGNLSADEIARFDRLAEQWWDAKGKYAAALLFNQARLGYIKHQLCQHFDRLPSANRPLTDIRILDLGCGGGLLSEPLAQLGASVTGIDASDMSIEVAKRHAQMSGVSVDYRHCLAAELVEKGEQFDVVINAEVLEHVPQPSLLVSECARLTVKGGQVILATLNRTFISWLFAIVGAEYVLRLLPIGTHSWSKFIRPEEMVRMAQSVGLKHQTQTGLAYNPQNKRWRLSDAMPVNYIMGFKKEGRW